MSADKSKVVDERTGLTEEEAEQLLRPKDTRPTVPLLPNRPDSGPWMRVTKKRGWCVEGGWKWTF